MKKSKIVKNIIKSSICIFSICAGAGTGKTYLLSLLISALLKVVHKNRILCLASYNATKTALEYALIKKGVAGIECKTVHSFCYKNLLKFSGSKIDLIHLKKYFYTTDVKISSQMSVIDEVISLKILKELDSNLSKKNCKDILDAYSIMIARCKPNKKHKHKEILRRYNEYKIEHNLIDYNDQLLLFYALLKTSPDVKEQITSELDYVIVDEVNDCSPLVLNILLKISSAGKLVAVGDSLQAGAYAYAGASRDCFKFLCKNRTDKVKTYTLKTNRRSTPKIIDLANASALKSEKTSKCTLRPFKPKFDGIPPKLYVCETQTSEIECVVNGINRLLDKGLQFGNICIGSRTINHNHFIRLLKKAFRGAAIRFYTKDTVKRYIDCTETFLDIYRNGIKAEHKVLINIFTRIKGTGVITAKKYLDKLLRNDKIKNEPTLKLIKRIKDAKGSFDKTYMLLAKYQNENIKAYKIISRYLKNLEDIKTWKYGFEKTIFGNKVLISSLNALKGDEREAVFLVSISDDMLPFNLSFDTQVDDERSLFYIGATRANKYLYMSYVQPDKPAANRMTRFLKEIAHTDTFVKKKVRHQIPAQSRDIVPMTPLGS